MTIIYPDFCLTAITFLIRPHPNANTSWCLQTPSGRKCPQLLRSLSSGESPELLLLRFQPLQFQHQLQMTRCHFCILTKESASASNCIPLLTASEICICSQRQINPGVFHRARLLEEARSPSTRAHMSKFSAYCQLTFRNLLPSLITSLLSFQATACKQDFSSNYICQYHYFLQRRLSN